MSPHHELAVVRPRVLGSGPTEPDTVLLTDRIAELRSRGVVGRFLLTGPPGSGRRTALALARERLAVDTRVLTFRHGEAPADAELEGGERLEFQVDLKSGEYHDGSPHLRLELAPWSRDEVIEYLLARHPTRVAELIARLERACEVIDPRGHVGTVRATIDAFARDESLVGVDEVIERFLVREPRAAWWPPVRTYRAAAVFVDSALANAPSSASSWLHNPMTFHAASGLARRRAGAVQALFERSLVVDDESAAWFRAVANRADPRALRGFLAHRFEVTQVLPVLSNHILAGADLSGAAWPSLRVRRSALARCNFAAADLTGSDCTSADLVDADLRDAQLSFASFERAKLRGARLDGAQARGGTWHDVNLTLASLRHVRFEGVDLLRAHLRGADVAGAEFHDCILSYAQVDGAWTNVTLDRAQLWAVDFRGVRFDELRAREADLRGANLEGLDVRAPEFSRSRLNAARLSGTRFARGSFVGADLRGAYLADIAWPGADLSGADLRGATFHLGTSRSGLVFGAAPSEGTRTGFYTPEERDLLHRPPEEVRHADLRATTWTDANVFETDFRLVDLRGARASEEQMAHFRRTGAIV